jgi:hypothetical protein
VKRSSLGELLNAISEQAAERDKKIRAGKWVPQRCNPETWLNQGRWLDSVMTDEEISKDAALEVRQKISYRDACNVSSAEDRDNFLTRMKKIDQSGLSYSEFQKELKNGSRDTGLIEKV